MSEHSPKFMTSGEVAALFGVNPRTVARWVDEGRLPAGRTLGGHRRYKRKDVEALYEKRQEGES
jgi:excisionase family DNA binding protein